MFSIAPDSLFEQAASVWLDFRNLPIPSGRSRYVQPRTLDDLRQYVVALGRFFAGTKLSTIHIGSIREYQRLRSIGELHPPDKRAREVGPNKVNQEVGALVRIMKHANCWTAELDNMYMPLQREESDVPRALMPKEQQYFLQVTSSRPEWSFVYWYALLGFDAPMSANEERGLRLGDLDLVNDVLMVRVRTSKNKYRTRTIPLTPEAKWAIERMKERAQAAGAVSPQHYLMPFKKQHVWNPDQSMTVSGIKKPWNEARNAAGLPWFRPTDLRHTSITRLAEAGTAIPIIMSMAGHVSRKMMEHYTHISAQAKRKAVESARTNGVFSVGLRA